MRQGRHRHHSPSLSFVVSGRYDECIGRQEHLRRMATLIYHPADENHAVESDVRILSIELGRGASSTADSLDHGSSHRSDLVAWLGARLGREMVRVDSSSLLAIDGLVAEMLAEGSRGKF